MTLDYASPQPRAWTFKSLPALAVLAACWMVYFIACGSAMGQRGYPPLEPHLQGMTLLWIAGVPLSALIQRFFWGRVWTLTIYAYATGFIDAASWPMMVPNRFNFMATAFMTLLLYGPIHMAATAVLEGISRLLARYVGAIRDGKPAPITVRVIVAILLPLGAGFLPSAYAGYNSWSLTRKGRSLAENDWSSHNAQIISREDRYFEPLADIRVLLNVDDATGLMLRRAFHDGYEVAYNQRIAELLGQYGKPAWAEPSLPPPIDLAKLLDANGFSEITKFPFDVTPNITVFHGGTISKWGTTSSSGGKGLSIATKVGGLIGVGGTVAKPTFVWQDPTFPKLVFIRDGRDWLGVFDEDGRYLADVSRN